MTGRRIFAQSCRWIRPPALAVVILSVAAAIADDATVRDREPSGWGKIGEAVPIAVTSGNARFTAPTHAKNEKTLVIVSSLARGQKSHQVELTARAAGEWTPPKRATEGPRRTPEVARTRPIAVPPKPTRRPPADRTFHLMVRQGDPTSASNYLSVRGVLHAVGERVQVYVDARACESVSEDLLRDIITTFDTQIFPKAARLWGPARDVDGDGRFTVLLSDWLSRFGGGRLAVEGFVRGADLDVRMSAPFSNHCDMMYLSTSLRPGPHLRTILAHEYAHAATFSHKAGLDGSSSAIAGSEEEGWLDEAIAHLVEDEHSFSRSNLDYRVSAFLSKPERYQLVVKDYYAADLFRSHGNRGSTYLFLRWCVDRYGPSLLTSLIRSPRRGVANLEAATGMPFPDLYRQWSTDLYLGSLDAKEDLRRVHEHGADSTREGWLDAGPRPSFQAPDGSTERWSMAGTSTHYAIIDGCPEGAVSIDIKAPPDAELQVTAVRLPPDMPRLELSVRRAPITDDGCPVRLLVRESEGIPVQLTQLAWEPLVPRGDAADAADHHGSLNAAQLKSAFGTLSLGANSERTVEPILLKGVRLEDGPVVIKLLGTDAKGRRIVAWTLLQGDEDGREKAVGEAESEVK